MDVTLFLFFFIRYFETRSFDNEQRFNRHNRRITIALGTFEAVKRFASNIRQYDLDVIQSGAVLFQQRDYNASTHDAFYGAGLSRNRKIQDTQREYELLG